MSSFFQIPYQSNTSLNKQKSYVHSLLLVLRKVTVMMHGNFLYATVQMVVLELKVFISINHTVQWHILTHSGSTFLLLICIYSLPVAWVSAMHSRIQMFPFMKEPVSVHHPIILTGLECLIPMYL